MIATATAPSCPLGSAIPAMVPHAISVSLPTWQDVIGYEEGEKRVVETMQTGYPRFFVHRSIQKVGLTGCFAAGGRATADAVSLKLDGSSRESVSRNSVSQTNSAPSSPHPKSLKQLGRSFSLVTLQLHLESSNSSSAHLPPL